VDRRQIIPLTRRLYTTAGGGLIARQSKEVTRFPATPQNKKLKHPCQGKFVEISNLKTPHIRT
jgi:hypothetical protein